ncbi:nucleotide exchange factor GrpE [Clostridium sp. DL1XJH146]
MINVKEELSKYKKIDISKENLNNETEIIVAVNSFTKNLERFSKEQYKTANSIDEIIEILEEKIEDNDINKELIRNKKSVENENKELLNGVIQINDLFEDIYFYSKKSGDESWNRQINILWNKLASINLKLGLIRIGDNGVEFDNNLHKAVEVREEKSVENNYIIEIVRYGYIYNKEILRKEEVIVNQKNKEL